MNSALLFLLLAAPEVSTPLGPYARPGVPALVATSEPATVSAGGWTFAISTSELVFVEQTPCPLTVDNAPQPALTLQPVPKGVRLVGVIGPLPKQASDPTLVFTAIRAAFLQTDQWSALDVFDRVLVQAGQRVPEQAMAALTLWVLGGGDLVWVDPLAGDAWPAVGIGRLTRGASFDAVWEAAGPVRPLRVPRAPVAAPEIYDLVGGNVGGSAPLQSARWIVLATSLALLIHLVLARRAGVAPRRAVFGCLLFAAVGTAIGLWRPQADYRALARGKIEIAYRGGGFERVRTFHVMAYAGPGARVVVPPGSQPVVYRVGVGAWWDAPGAPGMLEEGVVRLFVTESIPFAKESSMTPGKTGKMGGVIRARKPGWGSLAAAGSSEIGPPSVDPGSVPHLGRAELFLGE